MLLSVALLTSATSRTRAAVFLWAFAIWDISTTPPFGHREMAPFRSAIRYPVPHSRALASPVWFPLLVSA